MPAKMRNHENPNEKGIHALLASFSTQCLQNTVGHALLFHGLPFDESGFFLNRLSQCLLCADSHKKPCEVCQSCLLVPIQGHPDLTALEPEKVGGAIKIDSIRELHEIVYRSPQLGNNRVVLIRQIERMNMAASQALLKLLEEPPNNVYFILQATQLNSILPTILSRCQIWRVGTAQMAYQELQDFLSQTAFEDPHFAKVAQDFPIIVADLHSVLTQKKQFCQIAAKWLEYHLFALVMVFYWINACLIKQLWGQESAGGVLNELLPHVNLLTLFQQLEKLNQLARQCKQGISMNSLLMLEDFLLGYSASRE